MVRAVALDSVASMRTGALGFELEAPVDETVRTVVGVTTGSMVERA